MATSDILVVGSLLLVAKIWYDVNNMLRENMRLNSYSKITSCALEIMNMLREESRHRQRIKQKSHNL